MKDQLINAFLSFVFFLQDPCVLLDWQFVSRGNPLADYASLAYLSMNKEETTVVLEQLPDAYYDRFESLCLQFHLEVPWSRDEFRVLALREGLFLCFLWVIISYELADKFPVMKDRMVWACVKSLEMTPELFK